MVIKIIQISTVIEEGGLGMKRTKVYGLGENGIVYLSIMGSPWEQYLEQPIIEE